MITRRQFTGGCAGVVAAGLFRPDFMRGSNRSRLVERIDDAIRRAVEFLTVRQAADGAWRSEVYGPLKDGPSLTAFIAATLAKAANHGAVQPILSKAIAYLALIDPRAGTITYPVYAAAGAVVALSRQSTSRCAEARDAWVKFLRQQQLV